MTDDGPTQGPSVVLDLPPAVDGAAPSHSSGMGSDGDPVFTVEGIDHDIEELRQTLAVTHHPDSITLLWTRIDRLLDRRKRLTDALSGVPLEK